MLKKIIAAVLCTAMVFSFAACGERTQTAAESERTFTLEGNYFDSASNQAVLQMEPLEDGKYLATVMWGASSEEYYEWIMTVILSEDGSRLEYTDCKRLFVVPNDATGHIEVETIYENGSGYFSVGNWTIYWDGAEEESCRSCIFEK